MVWCQISPIDKLTAARLEKFKVMRRHNRHRSCSWPRTMTSSLLGVCPPSQLQTWHSRCLVAILHRRRQLSLHMSSGKLQKPPPSTMPAEKPHKSRFGKLLGRDRPDSTPQQTSGLDVQQHQQRPITPGNPSSDFDHSDSNTIANSVNSDTAPSQRTYNGQGGGGGNQIVTTTTTVSSYCNFASPLRTQRPAG